MIKLSDAAVEQIKKSIQEGNIDPMPIRFAVYQDKNNDFQYLMGFDDNISPSDETFSISGIDVVISSEHKALVAGMSVDYVELEKGKFNFIFKNPNDPSHGK